MDLLKGEKSSIKNQKVDINANKNNNEEFK